MSTEKERQEWADMAHTILTGERWDTNDRVMLANAVETLLREVGLANRRIEKLREGVVGAHHGRNLVAILDADFKLAQEKP